MALGAHRVPALVAARPVQRVVGRHVLVGVEVEPAPAPDVPRDRQRLQAAAGERDQHLLQRLDAEHVGHVEVLELARGTRRGHAERIARAVDTLPDEQREVFLMREIANLPFKEIAEITGVPENTVKSRMRYALERLQEALAEYEDYARALR